MGIALEIEQIASDHGQLRFRLSVLEDDLILHGNDPDQGARCYTEDALNRSLTAEHGLSERDAHLLIDRAKHRYGDHGQPNS